MQVFPSYFLCVKFLSVVTLCAQYVVADENPDTTKNPTTEGSLKSNENDLENNSTVLSTAVLTESTSTLAPNTTNILNITESTTVFSTTPENVTNRYVVTSTDINSKTTTEFVTSTFAPNTRNIINITETTTVFSTTLENVTNGYVVTSTGGNLRNAAKFLVLENTTDVTTPTTLTTDNTTVTSPVTTPVTTTTEQSCTLPDGIYVTVNTVFETEANVSVVFVSNGTLCPEQMNIYCDADGDNNTMWPWIVPSQNISFELNDNNTNSLSVMIGNLSEFTNYSCNFFGYSSIVPFNFTTEQAVPSKPVELNVNVLTATSFNVTWKEPEKIPSLLQGYQLTVIRGDVASEGHIWKNCSNESTFNITNLTETSYLFEKALPDFVYQVIVSAVSNVGYGETSNCTNSTPSAASDPPENVLYNLTETEINGNIDMAQTITWDLPCNSNGPVANIQVEMYGFYLYNQSRYDFKNCSPSIYENQNTYSCNFSDIMAATNYSVKIYLVGETRGNVYNYYYVTKDNYPSAPEFNTPNITSRDLQISWKEPDNYPGHITNYTVYIVGEGVRWYPTEYCDVSDAEYNETEYMSATYYSTSKIVPDATYFISVAAQTTRGQGNWTNMTVTSSATYPDPLKVSYTSATDPDSEDFNDNVTIKFQAGCFNGEFSSYSVEYVGKRTGFDDHLGGIQFTDYYVSQYTFGLKPEYSYTANVTIFGTKYSKASDELKFNASAGVPAINTTIISDLPIQAETSEISLTLNRNLFNDRQGSLLYLAIIISDENVTGGSFYSWENTLEWPEPNKEANIYYQATDKFWEPFKNSNVTEFVIGSNTTCNTEQYCNKPLEPAKQYYVFLRLFNSNYYRNTMPLSIITKKLSRVGMIVGIIAGFLVLSILGFVSYTLWRKKMLRVSRGESHGRRVTFEDSSDALLSNSDDNEQPVHPCRRTAEEPKTEVPVKKFVSYCKYLEQNPAVVTVQWKELENQSKTIYEELPHRFAELTENKRKNRYTNILPFDHSRVKLNIDEDDEICSDYINASYIKGFSGENEYIATQGPLSGTCRDFWKMILQERVSIIVMVSRFIENNRDKCYKYFPRNRETMSIIGDDIEVRCSMELHFGFYCIRTLQVKKELTQVTVTHMQFLEWPDFGVPNGTESMLSFCHQFKERWSSEGGMAVVHCSAGVGRTGTIIATDILLRAVAAGKKIDVFNTVLELRKQRQNMVQTEKQYMYIHQLVRSMIEFPIVDDQSNQEPLYQNVEVNNGIVESAL